MKVTPKERFALVINNKEADRPIVDLQTVDEIRKGLKYHFQIDSDDKLLILFHVDVRSVPPDYIGSPLKKFPDGSVESVFGYRSKEIITSFGKSFQQVYHPLAEVNTIDDFRKKYSFPPYEYYDFEGIKEKANKYSNYVLDAGWMSIWYLYFYLRGMEQSLIDMLLNKEFFHYVMRSISEYWKGYMKRVLESAEGSIDYVMTYEDFGTTEGLLVSLDNIRNDILIYYKDFAQFVYNYGAKFAFHSCGSIYPVIPDLINLGVSILDPIQVSAKGMEIKFLKERYGDKLTFRGGIDTTKLLPRGSREEVKAKVKNTVDVLWKNGGYIFCSSNAINADTPIENVLSMYEVVLGDKFWKK
ncbi:hypothetical protein AUJ66_02140 [Candidatus Desantisbacteria bacterium CG1_02_38_46]|uniref:Uroporphyrinogen decarboxylase (URO-D) domain-containing protein n=2 Tax=unclassified Candidatus Desantisiibacteriota TaxID=3106372 RepID=A0A2H9PEK9_9BACT|nr:MAG: hypothetical protein AUJ66_02140 [Candidatus Desantisbacteria bacterium CG1_02_38_46]PIZ17293.1 MAG: hypothetical protein COY51_00580 [Candidatus Desantisbacteria bacterium CG_4_10_14_0_8_um_filter_39_17]